MFKTLSFTLLFFTLSLAATAQLPPSQPQSRHDAKLEKKLSHYAAGTKLDIELSNGEHHFGALGETDSADFVLTDPVSGKTENIDYQLVKHVRTIRNEQIAQQLGRAGRGFIGGVQIALITIGTIAIILLVVTFATMHD
jgi:hypothetical protein